MDEEALQVYVNSTRGSNLGSVSLIWSQNWLSRMMAAIWENCVPRVADEDEDDDDEATRRPATTRRSVSFGQVTVFVHEASLDASKLPRCCTTSPAAHTSPGRKPGPLPLQ